MTPRRLRGHPGPSDTESRRTAVVAILANVGVLCAKGVAALLTGSAVMLAETFHSAADVLNELLLLLGVVRSSRPADALHPRGHGPDRWFWSLLAAVGILVAGGLASVAEGVRALLDPRPLENVGVGFAVLGVSAALEGGSWWVARRQLRRDAELHGVESDELIDVTTDPTPVTVYFEDSAAIAGLAIAIVAMALHWATGDERWDAGGSALVGLLLTVAAFGCLTTSYVSGEEGSRSAFSSLVLPVLVAIVVVLIFDIANPHKGFIGISQQSMIDLKQSIAVPPGG